MRDARRDDEPHEFLIFGHMPERVAGEFGVDVARPETRISFELARRWLRVAQVIGTGRAARGGYHTLLVIR